MLTTAISNKIYTNNFHIEQSWMFATIPTARSQNLTMLFSFCCYTNNDIAHQFATFIHRHRVFHNNSLSLRMGGRWSRWYHCGSTIRSISWKWNPHITHTNISNILADSTFDRWSSIRIHKCCPAVSTIDVCDLARCWCRVCSVTTGASYTCCPTWIHQQCPTTQTYKMSHFHP